MGKMTTTCVKSLLMLFNLSFWASGLVLMCIGAWIQMDLHKYLELDAEFSIYLPYIIIGTGVVIVIVGALACCWTLKADVPLLYMYGGFLSIMLIIELTVVASVYAHKERLADGFDRGLNQSMINYGPDSWITTTDFDLMQSTLHCCGLHNYKDYEKLQPPRPVPKSCCIQPNCDQDYETEIYTEGCYRLVVDFINRNMSAIAGLSLFISLFPLIGAILSCALASSTQVTRYEQIS